MQPTTDKTSTTFVLGDKVYDFIRKLVQIFIPAASSAYFGTAVIWGLPAPEKVVGTLAIVATFLGVLVHISSTQYNNSGAAYDGTVHVVPNDQGTAVHLSVDPHDLVDKSQVTLKVVSPPAPPAA